MTLPSANPSGALARRRSSTCEIKMTTPETDIRHIPFKKILVIRERNIWRSAGLLPKIRELADNLRERGQLTPVIVTPYKSEEHPEFDFLLEEGYRRMTAMEAIEWTDRDVLASVRDHKTHKQFRGLADGYTANMMRENPSAMELADALFKLTEGQTPDPNKPGEYLKALPFEDLIKIFNIEEKYAKELLRIRRGLTPVVVEKIKEAEAKDKNGEIRVPLRELRALSQIKGEGETKDDKKAATEKEQEKKLQQVLKQKEDLAASGRKRAPKTPKKGAEREPAAGYLNAKRRVITFPNSDEVACFEDYLEILEAKKGTLKGADGSYLDGVADAIKFVLGGVAKAPLMTVKELRDLYDARAAADEEEEEEDDEAAQ